MKTHPFSDLPYPWGYWPTLVRAAKSLLPADAAHDVALRVVEELLARREKGAPDLSLDHAARRAAWRARDARRAARRAPEMLDMSFADNVPDDSTLSPEAAGEAAMAELALGPERAARLAAAATGDPAHRHVAKRLRKKLKEGM